MGLTAGGGGKPVRTLRWVILLLVLVAAIYASRSFWLRQMGLFLVSAEAPEPAEIAVVLAGDAYGHRIIKAVDLVRQGYVKEVLVDGPRGYYDFDESKLAIQFAVDRGAPREIFTPLRMRARSTVTEVKTVDAELQKRRIRKALVVTSNFHTRRARSVFRRFGSPNIRYVMVEAPDEDFRPEDWWRTRDAQKVFVIEYLKLLDWWWERN